VKSKVTSFTPANIWAQRLFKGLVWRVRRSRLKPVVEVAQMLKRHWDNLPTCLKHHIANTQHAVRVRGGQRQL
jgi:hypothetical protein